MARYKNSHALHQLVANAFPLTTLAPRLCGFGSGPAGRPELTFRFHAVLVALTTHLSNSCALAQILGMVLDSRGPRITCIIGNLMSVAGFISMATLDVSTQSWLIGPSYFLTTIG